MTKLKITVLTEEKTFYHMERDGLLAEQSGSFQVDDRSDILD